MTSAGINDLYRLLEIDSNAFEKGYDLRLVMHGKHADKLRDWFLRRKNREVSPERELREELISETGLLAEGDFRGLRFGRPGYQTELAVTDRAGQEGNLTLRLIEVYPTTFNKEAVSKLLAAVERSDSMIRFVTDQEILDGISGEGLEIGSVSKTLLRPNNTIPKFK